MSGYSNRLSQQAVVVNKTALKDDLFVVGLTSKRFKMVGRKEGISHD